jgi:hypothetical protein
VFFDARFFHRAQFKHSFIEARLRIFVNEFNRFLFTEFLAKMALKAGY